MQQLTTFALFSLLVLLLCLIRPGAGRIFVGLFFLVMAIGVNVVLVLVAPDFFVALGTNDALIPLYRWFFENVIALAPPLFGLLAAAYEITIALMMLSKDKHVKWGLIGGIVFLIGITPLGVWTLANPILAVAMAYLLTKEFDRSILQMLHPTVGPRSGEDRGSALQKQWRERGAGLGLAIARQVAETHGGRIDARSELGKGSTFVLRIPREGPFSA